ncbi:hypothetical protein PJF56_08565 [Roseofilum sp. BLCC_M91]|uniref:DUF2330 domain-containing protein n=1 Tax=Roseofilum halophilum BLCC-M91 TaxID=3022259 RepID=A0ABT7BKU5_9CYAN|nr:hypothetical protein [Roseofilum halophilum]MDJ1178913.1 hypothetical protein [Roseofilum halophilum BLCC-M91]
MTTSLPAPQPKGSQKLQSVEYVWNLPSGIIPGALAATVLSLGAIAGSVYLRYGNFNLTQIPLNTETLSSSNLIGKQISFYRAPDSLYHIEFEISQNGQSTPILLSPVDLRLMIPQIPASIRENQTLTQWFLTEQEFNRQRVIFPAGSPEIHLRDRFMGYDPQDLSISLTNNCLGAGYWEVAIFAQNPDGQQKIYQGYFDFPKGAYARLVSELNGVAYWNHAPSIEPWPGFDFYSGMPFNLDSLRTVKRRYLIDAQDLNNENIFAINEQLSKAKLMVFNQPLDSVKTWEDLRQANPKFQTFVPPGIYHPDRLWTTDYSQIAHLQSATAKTIESPLADEKLLELELILKSQSGKIRKFVVSGLDWHQIPQVSTDRYDRGLYIPIGFAPKFTENYQQLKQNLPHQSPLFSVMLDGYNLAMNYRQDIGLNGLVVHRDIQNPHKLHFYFMSYERITLVSHYVLDLTQWVLMEYPEPEAMSAIKNLEHIPSMAISQVDLNQKVYTQLDQAWQENPQFKQRLIYRVFVDSQGRITGYLPSSPEAQDWVNNTPFSDLSLIADFEGTSLNSFRVVLTPMGGIEVSPWWGWNG